MPKVQYLEFQNGHFLEGEIDMGGQCDECKAPATIVLNGPTMLRWCDNCLIKMEDYQIDRLGGQDE